MESKKLKIRNTIEPLFQAVGEVVNCRRLNVRKAPNENAEVTKVIDSGSEVFIDLHNEIVGWHHIKTASNIEGYCMAEYIIIKSIAGEEET